LEERKIQMKKCELTNPPLQMGDRAMRKNGISIIIALMLILGMSNIVFAKIWYVDVHNPTPSDGTSWEEAFWVIQDAIDASKKKDKIWVSMGTYALTDTIYVDKAIAIYGGFAGWETELEDRDWEINVTTVDGQYSGGCFYITADAVLDGLAIINGYWGPSLYYDSGGVSFSGENLTITNCTFSENIGGGIYGDNLTITNSNFFNNSGGDSGGGVYGRNLTITNSTFVHNVADQGGGVYGHNLTITNSNFTGNDGDYGGGGIHASNSTITNSILWGNSADGEGPQIYDRGSFSTVTYCDIDQDGYAGVDGNIREDPMFVDADNGDFHIMADSSCRDAGMKKAPELPKFDFEGDPRKVGSAPDMGADEYKKGKP
jgi:predicted outer membrane repeat protein